MVSGLDWRSYSTQLSLGTYQELSGAVGGHESKGVIVLYGACSVPESCLPRTW